MTAEPAAAPPARPTIRMEGFFQLVKEVAQAYESRNPNNLEVAALQLEAVVAVFRQEARELRAPVLDYRKYVLDYLYGLQVDVAQPRGAHLDEIAHQNGLHDDGRYHAADLLGTVQGLERDGLIVSKWQRGRWLYWLTDAYATRPTARRRRSLAR